MRKSPLHIGMFKPTQVPQFSFLRSIEFPGNAGTLIRLTGDHLRHESSKQYHDRCIQEIHSKLSENPGCNGIFVTSTLLAARQIPVPHKLQDEIKKFVQNTRYKLMHDPKNITTEIIENSLWGHIAIYGSFPEEFVSHTGVFQANNRDEAIEHDVKIAIEEANDFRYLALIPKEKFPDTLEATRKKLRPYHLSGLSGTDNCSTACMKAAGVSESNTLKNRNPLLAFRQILDKTVIESLSEEEQAVALHHLVCFDVPTSLEDVAIEQCKIDIKRYGQRSASLPIDRRDTLPEKETQKESKSLKPK